LSLLFSFSAGTTPFAFGASRKISALILSVFLAIHKVCLRKTAFIRTKIFSGFALAKLCVTGWVLFSHSCIIQKL